MRLLLPKLAFVLLVYNLSETAAILNKAVACPENFSILAKSSCNFKLEIQESTLIKLLKPTLNKIISSVFFICFDIRKNSLIIP